MDKLSLQRKEIEEVYGKISPFELKDKLINLAEESKKSGTHTLLDAGRGNPNWIAASPREAFFTFGQFAIEESRKVWSEHDLAGMPRKEGITEHFIDFAKKHQDAPGIELLCKMIDYGIIVKKFNSDDWIYELVDGIIGDNYPKPDRMLVHVESVVNDYLVQELCYNELLPGKFKTFAVEGATAAMCYIFDTLIANNILSKGDKIALMAPIFTPYLEIPHLPRYNFEVVEVLADEITEDGRHTWQYSSKEIDKINDSSIKALFIVNPSNPGSVAMKPQTVNQLKNIVENVNPDLMIISDDVYGTFVDEFRSLMADLPYNTIGVYSYSKYFGVTGWRLGTISLYEDNVFDKLLRQQDEDKKGRARIRYGGISTEPDNIAFIDRIVADSRQVALNHTAGLSTPQQVQMAFFSVFAIIDKENKYKQLTKDICRNRKKLLSDGLGLDLQEDPFDASYYTQFDLLEWAGQKYNAEFMKYLQANYKPVDILIRLAEQSSIVLLGSSGFHGPEWAIRISLANLNDESYSEIGKVLHKVLEDYAKEWNESKQAK
ncbi:aspartate 4-decarboxylase [Clostridium tagluense]|uniref:aspartate 4-decarboxylase n=1 Tax=Clostridium TaxID=1485 RepID=UPI0013E9093C|nr:MULTISPECIES: aspartate 4-decarboxylase [Clostridium]MBU3129566.1 aspartate 4-decarboxylase [Clostridium tagluense]MBZ9623414.1 aspartate 4-decarboxylase [Clostridium sp. FP2]MCB2310930.1 aspartate 4-decarboxylase [Clostridium tagluense]MCB2315784.1 aspartate 4-decarboxylase [Clostridium tagluense]MCB2320572.1 aspartate 4-decarboxylase [Clostridium tagluense]